MTHQSDIVLVTVDSLRADHCSFAGYHRETTPTLDELARGGTVFENAVAPGPSTPESMPAVFTGDRFQPKDDGGDVSSIQEAISRHLAVRDTIPERLSRRGYTTAGFTPNPFTSRFFGFGAGFDRFEDFMGSPVRRQYGRAVDRLVGDTAIGSITRLAVNLLLSEEAFKPWEAYYDDIISWVQGADRPFFLWVHLMDPHVPYLPPSGYRSQPRWAVYHANYRFWREDKESAFKPAHRERLVRAYDDSVRYADAFIEQLHRDLGDDAVFAVHGDHGEAFGEHGTYGHEPYLYEENIHVPFVVSEGAGNRISTPVSLAALPSLLDAMASGNEIGPDNAAPFAVSRTERRDRTALRGETMKYIADDELELLYDLRRNEQDPVRNEELLDLCRHWCAGVERSESEARLIRAAAEELV